MKTEKQIKDRIEEVNKLEKSGVEIKLCDFRNALKWVLDEK
jgi:hypothetical protein